MVLAVFILQSRAHFNIPELGDIGIVTLIIASIFVSFLELLVLLAIAGLILGITLNLPTETIVYLFVPILTWLLRNKIPGKVVTKGLLLTLIGTSVIYLAASIALRVSFLGAYAYQSIFNLLLSIIILYLFNYFYETPQQTS